MTELQVGDRVQTKIGTTGTIIEPTSEMPLHHLVRLDNGNPIWILRKILERSSAPVQGEKKSRRSRKS